MSREICTTVFKFDELNDAAKKRARDWYRDGRMDYDDGWYESVFEDARQCFTLAGIKIKQIYFSGFSSQGDGACLEGTWSAADTKPVKAMKQHAPQDRELHRIASVLREVAKRDHTAFARVKHRGHYYHEYETAFAVDSVKTDTEDAIIDAMRDAMRWIYRQLEKEHDYQSADEQVDESIRINEYEFTEEGRIA